MARIRSPGYPSFSLEQAIEFARKIHAEDRQHPVDRATAARHMGFSGPSGASDRALSAIMHFDLVEKVQKGEIRVTDAALQIIHPDNDGEYRRALHNAGFAPGLFSELRERYPEAPPSRESLASFLSRSGFASAAIPSAARAYLETCYFLQRTGAYESDGNAPDEGSDLGPQPNPEPFAMTPFAPSPPPATASPQGLLRVPAGALAEAVLNKINMNIQGDRVHLDATLDLNGLAALEKKITSLKELLDAPEPEVAVNTPERSDEGTA